jgi:tetratricopeptide (TPR) repeat protein
MKAILSMHCFIWALLMKRKMNMKNQSISYSEAIKAGISEDLDQYHRGLARINSATGHYKEADRKLSDKSKIPHNDPKVYFYMASASEQYLKDKSKSIEYYQKFLSANTSDTSMKETARIRVKLLKEQRFMKGDLK